MIAFYRQTGNAFIPGRLYTFLITRHQSSLYSHPDAEIQDLIRNYLTQIRVTPSHFRHKEEYLYNLLAIDSLGWKIRKSLLGAISLDTFRELVFIPHKDLYQLPFSALPAIRTKVESLQSWAEYPFLIKNIPVP